MRIINKFTLAFFACTAILSYGNFLMAEECNENRYQSAIFSDSQSFSNVTYTKEVPELQFTIFGNENIQNTDLRMDIRIPPSSDAVTKRPAIIWAHSGGFILGSKANDDMQAMIDTFARRGYVTASIQYRLGMNILDDISAERAVYRGTQDAYAAVRFFRENAVLLGVDPNLIFVAGSSAGAVTNIHLAYVENSERPASSFEQTNGSNEVIADDLGDIEAHQIEYITNDNLNNPISNSINSSLSGLPNTVVACWGGIGDLDWLNLQTNTPPAILLHGLDDSVVYPDCQQPFQGLATMPVLCGSEEMDIKMTAVGIPHETHLYTGEGHEFWGATNGDFGGDNQPDNPTLWQEAIDKIGDFLYELIPQVATPDINGLIAVCPQTHAHYTTPELPNATYCWDIEGGTIVANNGFEIEVLWGMDGMGSISLQVRNENGMVSEANELLVNISPIRVKVKALLEGMFDDGAFSSDLLSKNLIPTQQPYGSFPWLYDGSESMSIATIPSNAVDWVLIEARNPGNKFEVLDQAAALLLSNGKIVAADNPSQDPILCNLQHGQSYHLVVRHRNHLDIMSSVAVMLPNAVAYDFTSNASQAEGTNQLIDMGTLGFAMILGDVNGDGVMSLMDFNDLLEQTAQLNGYQSADFDFDGHVLIRDFNLYQKNASAIGVVEIRY